jgi:hypothetical protein
MLMLTFFRHQQSPHVAAVMTALVAQLYMTSTLKDVMLKICMMRRYLVFSYG